MAWQELRNKWGVYRLVTTASRGIVRRSASLPEAVTRARESGPFPTLWSIEGVGLHFMDRAWDGEGEPAPFLPSLAGELGSESLLMLHAGMGLSFTRRLLARLSRRAAAGEVAATAREIVRLCRAGSLPGYEAAALESIGMVTRCFFRRSTEVVARTLAEDGCHLANLFWHGAGRGLYFRPESFLPGRAAVRRAFARAAKEPPDAVARASAEAALAWAITLVNLRQPELVVDRLLTAQSAGAGEASLRHGIAAAVVVRRHTTPGSRMIQALFAHRPPDPETAVRWRALAGRAGSDPGAGLDPEVAAGRELLELFSIATLTPAPAVSA